MYVDRNRLATDSHRFVIFTDLTQVITRDGYWYPANCSNQTMKQRTSSLHPLFDNFPSGDRQLFPFSFTSAALHIPISISLPHPLHLPPPQSTLPPLSRRLPRCLPPSLSDAPVSPPVSYFPDQRKLSRPVAVVGVKGLKVCICVCESIFIAAHF